MLDLVSAVQPPLVLQAGKLSLAVVSGSSVLLPTGGCIITQDLECNLLMLQCTGNGDVVFVKPISVLSFEKANCVLGGILKCLTDGLPVIF